MKVIVAQSAGFCWGVKRAVEKARHLLQVDPNSVYTDGPLIHNDQMMEQLRQEGLREVRDLSSLAQGTLLIRAHGIPPERRVQLEQLPVQLADATCPDVARIQGTIRKFARRGFHIILFGDQGHAEVIGLLGYAEGRGHVVQQPEDVANLPVLDPVCLVSQSTQLPEHYERIAIAIRARFPNADVLDTICASTRNRQADLLTLAARVDAIVVVGSKHSANTLRLVELARTLKPTFSIEKADQLHPGELMKFHTVGLTAGASTPDFIIAAVRQAIEGICSDRNHETRACPPPEGEPLDMDSKMLLEHESYKIIRPCLEVYKEK